MAEKIKRHLYKLRKHFYKFVCREPSRKETLEGVTDSKPSYIHENTEKRREEAIEYLIKKYYESKIRGEEFRKKLQSYGRVRRWIYQRTRDLKVAGMIFKAVVAKPVGLTYVVASGWFSVLLAVSTSSKILGFIDSIVPSPYNKVVGIIVTFPIGFSPIIIALVSYGYYVKKEIKKRLREEYGIEA